jgi:chromosome segregation ATPase
MNIEFFVSLGISIFSAGIVLGILKTDVKHQAYEFEKHRAHLDKIVEEGSPKVQFLEERIKEMTKKNDEHEAAMHSFTKTMAKIENAFETLSKKIDELAKDVKELSRGRIT